VKHILADGDTVLVHAHQSATPQNEFTGSALFELFRVVNGVIVEHWRMSTNVPATTASGNSMFSDLYTYAGRAPKLTEAQEEDNKQLTLTAYDGLFNGHRLELLDQFWDPVYLQHNTMVPNGTEGLKRLIGSMPASQGPVSTFYRAVADGDLVFIYNGGGGGPGAGPQNQGGGFAVGDLFRMVNGKIVEHWDAGQPVPAISASGYSMFSQNWPPPHYAISASPTFAPSAPTGRSESCIAGRVVQNGQGVPGAVGNVNNGPDNSFPWITNANGEFNICGLGASVYSVVLFYVPPDQHLTRITTVWVNGTPEQNVSVTFTHL
jgi:predicted SnoaL-like aldol condensation-catalyzing enzyme